MPVTVLGIQFISESYTLVEWVDMSQWLTLNHMGDFEPRG